MSSTNKTANYNLSQFIGTDKPAWLTDYNSDMSKIDAGIDAAKDTADAASGTASAATTSIGDLTTLTTTAKTDLVSAINEVDTNADTAQLTANNAANTASSADGKANTLISQFNLSVLKQPNELTYTSSVGTIDYSDITIVSNQDQSLAKIYGEVRLSSTQGSGTCTVTIGSTGLTLDAPITINGSVYRYPNFGDGTSAGWACYSASFTIASDGTITLEFNRDASKGRWRIFFNNSLLFLKNFGDIPQPE